MNTQKRLNMNIGNYTKPLRDDLRKSLLITLTLLFVCPGVWGQGTGTGTSEDPYLVSTLAELQAALEAGGHIQFQHDISFSAVTLPNLLGNWCAQACHTLCWLAEAATEAAELKTWFRNFTNL